MTAPPSPVPGWRPGTYIWPRGRTKLVVLGGVGSQTGEGERAFSGLTRFLALRGGYDVQRDVLEATYTGGEVNGRWRPRPYAAADTRRALIDAADAVAGALEWYRDALPADARLVVMGYSLGGVAALDGATLAVARDRTGWRDKLAAVVTVAAPVRGCNVGPLINWAWLVTAELDPLGQAGRDLDARWRDPEEQTRIQRRAAFLRTTGTRLLTVADPADAIVRPEEALLPAAGEGQSDLLMPAQVVRPGTLGHGAILDEPALWQRVLALIGPQEITAAPPAPDPIDTELEALKRKLRAEGRLK